MRREGVELSLARHNETRERLIVEARTDRPQCTLTSAGFGPMEPEDDHRSYFEDNLGDEDAASSAGSHTGPFQ